MDNGKNSKKFLSVNIKILIATLGMFILFLSIIAFIAIRYHIDKNIQVEQRNLQNINNVVVDALSSASQANRHIKSVIDTEMEEINEILSAQRYIDNVEIGKEGYFVAFNEMGFIKLHSDMENLDTYGFDYNGHFYLIHDEILDYTLANTPSDISQYDEFDSFLIGEKRFTIDGKRYFARIERWVAGLYVASVLDEYNIINEARKEIGKIVMFLIITMSLASLVYTYVIRRLVGDKMKIIEVNAQKFGHGEFENLMEIEHTYNDEIIETNQVLIDSAKNMLNIIRTLNKNSQELLIRGDNLQNLTNSYIMASDEIVAAIDGIATGSEKQADETLKGLEELELLTEITDDEREMLERLNERIQSIDKLKEEGDNSIELLMEHTDRANNTSTEAKNVIEQSNLNVQKIKEASIKIKEIADQTNLLALNASIEAARVGEHGRGFAVVAEEIRKLSEESNQFTIEIEEIIKELLSGSEKAVDLMNQSNQVSKYQTESVKDTGVKFQQIKGEIEGIKKIIDEINDSTTVMEAKKNELKAVVTNLSAIAQENYANTEEVSARVTEQNNNILQLEDLSNQLRVVAKSLKNELNRFS